MLNVVKLDLAPLIDSSLSLIALAKRFRLKARSLRADKLWEAVQQCSRKTSTLPTVKRSAVNKFKIKERTSTGLMLNISLFEFSVLTKVLFFLQVFRLIAQPKPVSILSPLQRSSVTSFECHFSRIGISALQQPHMILTLSRADSRSFEVSARKLELPW